MFISRILWGIGLVVSIAACSNPQPVAPTPKPKPDSVQTNPSPEPAPLHPDSLYIGGGFGLRSTPASPNKDSKFSATLSLTHGYKLAVDDAICANDSAQSCVIQAFSLTRNDSTLFSAAKGQPLFGKVGFDRTARRFPRLLKKSGTVVILLPNGGQLDALVLAPQKTAAYRPQVVALPAAEPDRAWFETVFQKTTTQ